MYRLRRDFFPETFWASLILLALTLATRAWTFGNPVIGIDEQFYLTIGDRLLRGDLLYVDIWDRKPVGLFLIYSFACLAFADPVIGYQLLAVISIVATSSLLFAIARRLTSFTAALAGAAAYPAWLTVFSGMGGQASIFYNLPMTAAAALTLAVIARTDDRSLVWRGCGVMLLTGLAIQVKYTVIFEGIYFGLTLLWAEWMRGRSPIRTGACAIAWVACALAPTLAVCGVYFALGRGTEFVEANFLSIFGDHDPSLPAAFARLAGLTAGISPFLVCAWIAARHWRNGDEPGVREARWILAWAGASLGGFLIYGVWFDFYVLPLLVPFGVVAALAFDCLARSRHAIAVVVGLGLAGGIGRALVQLPDPGTAQEVSRMTALMRPHLRQGCIYVNEGLPILYYLMPSCLPSRYIFPEHLTGKRYQYSLGVDQLAELRRIFATRPSVVVKSTAPDDDTRPASRALLDAELAKDYRIVGQSPVGTERFEVYARRDARSDASPGTP